MRNQTSFRLTTTLLPTDTTAKTTTVINKVDSNGDKFYPTFTEETVVLTNDDRTVMETTRAVCTNGVLTFTKRGLSDDAGETQVPNRKLTWNPGTLAFITAGAGDWIDKDDNITWSGNQTYTGDMTSQGTATYKGRLITEKGVEYPHFDNVAALEAYASPFGGMFAVVDSSGELYRYNAVTEEWSVVESSTPTNPEMASTTTIGTVRGATDTEFNNGTATGSSGELLVATPAQIQSVTPALATRSAAGIVRVATQNEFDSGTSTGSQGEYLIPDIYTMKKRAGVWRKRFEDENEDQYKLKLTAKGQDLTTNISVPFTGFVIVKWTEQRISGTRVAYAKLRYAYELSQQLINDYNGDIIITHYDLYYIEKNSIVQFEFESTSAGSFTWNDVNSNAKEAIIITNSFYFGFQDD